MGRNTLKSEAFDKFEAVADLTTEAKRRLLEGADPVERVWAAWALGLELGATARPELLSALLSDPSPGLRRQLIVVLAGLGERAAIRVLATSDPDEYVRATACLYLVRIAPPGDDDAARFAADRLLSDGTWAMRTTLLGEAAAGTLQIERDILETVLGDPDFDVRSRALAVLVAMVPRDLVAEIFERHIGAEPDPRLRRRLVELCVEAGCAAAVVRQAAALRGPATDELLSLLEERHTRLAWADLEPLARLDDPELDMHALRLLDPADAGAAFIWLVGCLARAADLSEPESVKDLWRQRDLTSNAWRAGDLLLTAPASASPSRVRDSERGLVARAISCVEENLRQTRLWLESEDEEWIDPEVPAALEELIGKLRSLLDEE